MIMTNLIWYVFIIDNILAVIYLCFISVNIFDKNSLNTPRSIGTWKSIFPKSLKRDFP